MKTRFILRFDDICPTMNWEIWNAVEQDLIDLKIRPILAVVPDNRDKHLVITAEIEDFWSRVRSWQERGWTIGLHGYQHRYLTSEAGMFGRTGRSEFAGLPTEIQEIKLRNAMNIFQRHNVLPEVWVAPAHSFDSNTIALLLKLGIRIISDGYAIYPYRDEEGVTWIPQQFGKFRRFPFGVWTICCHVNDWSSLDLAQFRRDLQKYRSHFTTVSEVLQAYRERRRSWLEFSANSLLGLGLRIGRPLRDNFKRFDPSQQAASSDPHLAKGQNIRPL